VKYGAAQAEIIKMIKKVTLNTSESLFAPYLLGLRHPGADDRRPKSNVFLA
jgi:hypothetical protein